ncbi:HEPN domain-containing protein [Arthrobacter sp. ERGS1:01]|uniref:HEPN domain-containing protein n=1 Tax=Arthrobacter sp. ERGS1:01 TaxID=1704044 RepID=UPI0012373EB5|nr:HEPN domain-containing protein [Arthrobacter sp. ERGS1:01]
MQTSRNRLVELRNLVDIRVATAELIDLEEMQRQLARFLVVRSAGHLEFTLDECIAGYVESRADPSVISYVKSGLKRGSNPWPKTLVGQVAKFKGEWGSVLESQLAAEDERLNLMIKHMVGQRNSIAHGQNEGVTVRKSLDYCQAALEVADWLVTTMNPGS